MVKITHAEGTDGYPARRNTEAQPNDYPEYFEDYSGYGKRAYQGYGKIMGKRKSKYVGYGRRYGGYDARRNKEAEAARGYKGNGIGYSGYGRTIWDLKERN